jgi:hypothetical protein
MAPIQIVLIGVSTAAVVILLTIRNRKRKKRKELIRKTHAISERRKWKLFPFINELLADGENFTPDGLMKIKSIMEERDKFKSDMDKKLHLARNEIKKATTELKAEILFDHLHKVDFASDAYSLQANLLQMQVNLTVYQYQLEIIFTALNTLSEGLRNDPLFVQKLSTVLEDDIAFLERRKKYDIAFSSFEIDKIDIFRAAISFIAIPTISDEFTHRVKKLTNT